MKPDKCSFCKGRLVRGKTDFVVRAGKEVHTLRDVPAFICEECGEAYYLPETSEKIDRLMKKFHASDLLVHPVAAGELSYSEVAA